MCEFANIDESVTTYDQGSTKKHGDVLSTSCLSPLRDEREVKYETW